MEGEDVTLSQNSRVSEHVEASKKKKRSKKMKINPDVMIPSVVSVENLSRLLNIRLGENYCSLFDRTCSDCLEETLQDCMRRNGMEELSSYDHSTCRKLADIHILEIYPFCSVVLNADDASLLAMEFNRNPLVDDEAAFDICAS